MNVYQLCAVALVTVILSLTIKSESPSIAVAVATTGGIVILWTLLPQIGALYSVFESIDIGVVDEEYTGIILKSVAVAYISQLTSQLCADFGYGYIGGKVELAGKIIIISYSVPLIGKLVNMISYIN